MATPDYFSTIGIPIVRGRGFSETDGPNSSDIVVVNDVFMRRFFGGEDPIGKRVVLYGREIVGVVGAVRHRGFRAEPNPEMIVPSKQFQQFGGMTIVLKSIS